MLIAQRSHTPRCPTAKVSASHIQHSHPRMLQNLHPKNHEQKEKCERTFQQQAHPTAQLASNPPHRKCPQYMPVRHQEHIASLRGLIVFRFADGGVVEAGADVVD